MKYGYEYEIDNLKKSLKDVESHMDSLGSIMKDLIEKNESLESELAKDNKIKELTEALEYEKDLNIHGFPITKFQSQEVEKYRKEHLAEMHNVDGSENSSKRHYAFYYEFVPTAIGTFGSVICETCRERAIFESKGNITKYRELLKEYKAEHEFQKAW